MEQTNRELTLTRVFDAPRELIFTAWTDGKLLVQWWGPKGFTTPIAEIDARPGGKINIVMEDAEGLIAKGSRYPMIGQFDEVVAPERLAYTASPIMNGQPILETKTTVTFVEQDGRTTMTVHVLVTKAPPEAEAPLAGMETGWSQSLDKLVELMAI
jgi:uncharacterized protein YndB with AHSA1/START domain